MKRITVLIFIASTCIFMHAQSCLCCSNAYAQKCDSLFYANDSSLCLKTENGKSKKSLSKKKSSRKAKDNKSLMKYVNLKETAKDSGKEIKINPPAEYRKDEKDKIDNFGADLIKNIIFR